jgi:hypothetical protein
MTPALAQDRFDIFLSYHSGDGVWVAQLKNALSNKGLRIWLDQEQIRPGDLFIQALEKGVESCECLVIVISPGALRSPWVEEEYNRALTVANSRERRLRLIPLLLQGAELPGFLASRQWVDFREPGSFDRGIERLAWGVRGCRDEAASPSGPPSELPVLQPPVSARAAVDEIGYLERTIQRDQQTIRRLRLVQLFALLAGLAMAAYIAASAQGPKTIELLLIILGTPLLTILIAFVTTAKTIAACKARLDGMTHLKDGLQLCRAVKGPGCDRMESTFWQLVERSITV